MKKLILLFSIVFFTISIFGQSSENRFVLNADFTVVDIKMRGIQGGTFTMGSNDSEARKDETPHTVTVDDFAMMTYEVTVNEYKKFIDATGYQTDAEKGTGGFGSLPKNITAIREYTEGINWRCGVLGEPRPKSEYNHPVIHVSFNDAVAYADWLSSKTGEIWQLPTEAEWEYAARGGENFKFSGSNNIDEVGWCSKNSGGGTNPVGQKKPNNYGLYDMTGNVWEMCSDWSDKKYYQYSPQDNPQGPSSGRGRILRGGSWNHQPQNCRVSFRHHRNPNARNCINGFRLVFAK